MKGRTKVERKKKATGELSPAIFASPSKDFDSSNRLAPPTVGHDFSSLSTLRPQAKLTVSQPGDQYEKEADRVADQVMRMEKSGDDIESTVPQIARKEQSDIQLADDVTPIAQAGLQSSGQPLDADTRAFMEPHFGHDFSKVRIHTGAIAEESAASLNARAYTSGRDIVFGESQYDPHGVRGQQLLAHELAHVVQIDRSGMRPDPSRITPTNHASEAEARAASQPGAMPVISTSPVGLALDTPATPIPYGAVVLPPEEIKGKDPNIVRPPGGTIKAGERPDEETQKVMAGIAETRTRAMGYLNGTKSEVIMAVDAFKGVAQSQIDAIDGEPSDIQSLIPVLVGAIGAAVSTVFPPAGLFVIATQFTANLANTSSQAAIKAEGGKVKQGLKDGMQAFALAASNAQSIALADASNQVSNALTNLSVSDNNVWNMLALHGDRQQDDVIARLGIVDPAKQSPYGKVLAALMVPFGAWIAKEKYEMGKTAYEKIVAESLPGEQSFKDLHKEIKESESAGGDLAKKMAEEHAKKPGQ